jgi:coenzyme F420 hydrogenase subunit beta
MTTVQAAPATAGTIETVDTIEETTGSARSEDAPAKPSWSDLYREVVVTDVCAGCGACVVACPRRVLDYSTTGTRPYQTDEESGPAGCRFGDAGCDVCTRVCARFRPDPAALDVGRFGRARRPDEVVGTELDRLALRAIASNGQDGGLVTAMLAWAMRTGRVDAAVVSRHDPEQPWRNLPVVVTDPDEVLTSAGSRYTYSRNLLMLQDASPKLRLAFVGLPCQVAGLVKGQTSGLKRFRPVVLSIALMCSETFEEDAFLHGLLEERFGLDLARITKVNIKGKLLVHTDQNLDHVAEGQVSGSKAHVGEGNVLHVPLREVRPTVRPQCGSCTDFAGEWADLSAGGVGMDGWTMAVVRTPIAAEWVSAMVDAQVLEAKPATELPEASALLERLATNQRGHTPRSRVDVRPAHEGT